MEAQPVDDLVDGLAFRAQGDPHQIELLGCDASTAARFASSGPVAKTPACRWPA
jgi:hypothetical protein